jgi:hypothetical protein
MLEKASENLPVNTCDYDGQSFSWRHSALTGEAREAAGDRDIVWSDTTDARTT